jgi:hypothetical protein
MKEVVLVTTKPNENTAEYGIRENGQWLVHGIQVAVNYDGLSPEHKATVDAARTLLQALATADATAKGLL